VAATESPRSLIFWTIAMAALAVIVLWAAYEAREILLLLYISMLFAIGFSPVVRLIERQRLLKVGTQVPRWLAILTLYVLIIGALVAIGFMVVPPLIEQARGLWGALPDMLHRGQQSLIKWGLIDHEITLREAVDKAPGTGGDAVGTVVAGLWGFVGGIFGIVTILILTFYLLIESDSLFETFLRLFPRQARARVGLMSRQITIKVSAWLTGQLVLGAVIGATAAIGLGLMRVPYFYVLALIAAVGEMIPVVGPLLAAVPAIAVAATVSPGKVVGVIIFFIVQQQFENHVLVPKVMERQVGVSPVTVIVALLIGGSLLGIVGAILAVPTAAILQVIFQELQVEKDA
jgi:predicted PurR-regulated permease PerM